jgi:hypothetical protein
VRGLPEAPNLKVGDMVHRRLGGYAAMRCVEQQDTIRSLSARIGTAMRQREMIVLGHLGADGCWAMTTREGFYRKANELGHCSLEEYTALQAYFGGLGTWC